MRVFWGVETSAALHFTPPSTRKVADSATPELYAGDVFVVQLEGVLEADLYEFMFPFPAERHLSDAEVLRSARDTARDTAPRKFTLAEGDVLYVPRGCSIDMRTTKQFSLHVILTISTHLHTLDMGIASGVRALRMPDAHNLLDEGLGDDHDLPPSTTPRGLICSRRL